MTRLIPCLILVAAAACYSALTPSPAPRARGAGLGDCAFLAGAWKGAMDGDRVEEHWSAPDGAGIIGMFRWIGADGATNMCEILAITQEPEGVMLRLRHFDAKLTPWASETAPMTLRLAESAAGKAVFRAVESEKKLAAVTYHSPTPDALHILVEFPGGAREPLDFRLKRAAAAAK